jgi:Cu(I)/Ag(I) efflux system membrane fusion protein
MTSRSLIIGAAAAAALVAATYIAYQSGLARGIQNAAKSQSIAQTDAPIDPASGKRILYWHDPMVPGQKFDKPGKSPFMDMQLVPVYADADGGNDQGQVTVSPRMQQNLGMRTAEVTRGTLAQGLEASGAVAWNERDTAVVTARVNGFIEKLYVRATLDPVRKGQPLAEVYAPDWVAAQEEYLSVRRMQGQGTDALLAAARQRMQLAGMNEEQVKLVETSGTVQPRFTLVAPIGGVIGELGAREGMTVMAGALLFRISGLGSVWVYAEVPESAAAQVVPGSSVEARTPSRPEQIFKGRVAAILPEINQTTRTLKVRIEIVNNGGALTPGMFASVNFTPAAKTDVLLVPSEAIIATGRRKVVIAEADGGKFLPVDVETGAEANGQTEIRKGLTAGQKIVVSGQFLIDSESSLKSTTARMAEPPATKAATTAKVHRGEALVETIASDAITLSHGPIATLEWPPMTMDFKPPVAGMPKNVRKGDRVAIEFKLGDDGLAVLTGIKPLASAGSGSAK